VTGALGGEADISEWWKARPLQARLPNHLNALSDRNTGVEIYATAGQIFEMAWHATSPTGELHQSIPRGRPLISRALRERLFVSRSPGRPGNAISTTPEAS
jgi:hypothetical protein